MGVPDHILSALLTKISGVAWESGGTPPKKWSELSLGSLSALDIVSNFTGLSKSEIIASIQRSLIDPRIQLATRLLDAISSGDWQMSLPGHLTPLLIVSNYLQIPVNELKGSTTLPPTQEILTTQEGPSEEEHLIPWTQPLLKASSANLDFDKIKDQLRRIIGKHVAKYKQATTYEGIADEIWTQHAQLFSDFGKAKAGRHHKYLMQYLIRLCLEEDICSAARAVVESAGSQGIKYIDVIKQIKELYEYQVIIKIWSLYAKVGFLRAFLKDCFVAANFISTGKTASLRWFASPPSEVSTELLMPVIEKPGEAAVVAAPLQLQSLIDNIEPTIPKQNLQEDAQLLVDLWQIKEPRDYPDPTFTSYNNFEEFAVDHNEYASEEAIKIAKNIVGFDFSNPWYLGRDAEWYQIIYDHYLKHKIPIAVADLNSVAKRFHTTSHHICRILESIKVVIEACQNLPPEPVMVEKKQLQYEYNIIRRSEPKNLENRFLIIIGATRTREVPSVIGNSGVDILHLDQVEDMPSTVPQKPDMVIELRKSWRHKKRQGGKDGLDLVADFNKQAKEYREALMKEYKVKTVEELPSHVQLQYLSQIRDVPLISGLGWSEIQETANKMVRQWDISWFLDIFQGGAHG